MASQIRALKLTFAKHGRAKGRTFRSASASRCSDTLVRRARVDCSGVFLLDSLSLASDRFAKQTLTEFICLTSLVFSHGWPIYFSAITSVQNSAPKRSGKKKC